VHHDRWESGGGGGGARVEQWRFRTEVTSFWLHRVSQIWRDCSWFCQFKMAFVSWFFFFFVKIAWFSDVIFCNVSV
jgi:hypothetical protein